MNFPSVCCFSGYYVHKVNYIKRTLRMLKAWTKEAFSLRRNKMK